MGCCITFAVQSVGTMNFIDGTSVSINTTMTCASYYDDGYGGCESIYNRYDGPFSYQIDIPAFGVIGGAEGVSTVLSCSAQCHDSYPNSGSCRPGSLPCCPPDRTWCTETSPNSCYEQGGRPQRHSLDDSACVNDRSFGGYYYSACIEVACNRVRCCIECTNLDPRCRITTSVEDCETRAWLCPGGAYIASYPITGRVECQDVCGKEKPCCLPSGQCSLLTYRTCETRGGEPSGACTETCFDQQRCCPPPIPCCYCGHCLVISELLCGSIGGTKLTWMNDEPQPTCTDALKLTCLTNYRVPPPPCHQGVFLPVRSRDTGWAETFELQSTAPLTRLEPYTPAEYRRGYFWRDPWFCHDGSLYQSPTRNTLETMGFALQRAEGGGGVLGECVPPGYGAYIGQYRDACEPEIPQDGGRN